MTSRPFRATSDSIQPPERNPQLSVSVTTIWAPTGRGPPSAATIVANAKHKPSSAAANMCGRMSSSSPLKSRSEEHTSELQSLMRISYAVFCLPKNKHPLIIHINHDHH